METRHWRPPACGCKTDFRNVVCVIYIYDDGQCSDDENQCHRYGNRSSRGWNRTDILSVRYVILTAKMGSVEDDWNKCNFVAASPEDVSSASSRSVFYNSYTVGSGRYVL